jgi:hypothetical protein
VFTFRVLLFTFARKRLTSGITSIPPRPRKARANVHCKIRAKKRLLHPAFASRHTKTSDSLRPKANASRKRNPDNPVESIGKDAHRETKLRKVTTSKNYPFRVKRALLYQLSYQPTKGPKIIMLKQPRCHARFFAVIIRLWTQPATAAGTPDSSG